MVDRCSTNMIIICAILIIDVLFLAFLMIKFPASTSNGVIVSWEKILGTYGDDGYGYVVTDGEYIYATGGFCQDRWVLNIFVAKFDANGNEVWRIVWGYGGNDVPGGIWVFNNTIYVVGYTYNSSTKNYDIFILSIDSNGNILWVSMWDSGSNDILNGDYLLDYWVAYRSLFVCENGIFVVETTASSNGRSIVILRYNFDGKLLWSSIWSAKHDSVGRSIFVHKNKIYVLGTILGGKSHPVILIYDLDGNLIESFEYEDLSVSSTAIWVYGGNIYICGNSDEEKTKAIIMKLSLNGSIEWSVSFSKGERSEATDMIIYGNTIYVAGNVMNALDYLSTVDIFILKFNSNGNLIWSAIIDDYSRGNPKISVLDSQIYVSGRITSSGTRLPDVFIMKLLIDNDLDGTSDIEEEKIGTDPSSPDTDGDLFWDGTEILIRCDPKDAKTPLLYFLAVIIVPLVNIITCTIKTQKRREHQNPIDNKLNFHQYNPLEP